VIKYAIFETKWGYFGLVGTENSLFGSCLPTPSPRRTKQMLLGDYADAIEAPGYLPPLQRQIIAYFEGSRVNFVPPVQIMPQVRSSFARSVLTACRTVRYGHTISYGLLALRAGRAGATRAVGSVLAANPVPLIIPCHRVVRADGQIGGFSAVGGGSLKKRMLELERHGLTRCRGSGRPGQCNSRWRQPSQE